MFYSDKYLICHGHNHSCVLIKVKVLCVFTVKLKVDYNQQAYPRNLHIYGEQSVMYRYREFFIFWWYRNWYGKKLVPEKSLGTGIGKIWYRKKSQNQYWHRKKYRYRKKVSISVSFNILGTVTHCTMGPIVQPW